MDRLDHADPGVRFATAKGTWKLRDPQVVRALIERLEDEDDPEVRVALAVNALAAASDTALDRRLRRRLWRDGLTALHDVRLPAPEEDAAAQVLYYTYRYGSRDGLSEAALEELRRYWAE